MLSTPLICCSIGVATACSMVWASAPTYVAEICTSGGAICGNSATGRLTIDTLPTMTVTMAITIATMGRLMKNFDIWFRTHLYSLADFLQTFHNHTFAGLDTLVDDPFRTDGLGNLHRPDLHRIAIVDDS